MDPSPKAEPTQPRAHGEVRVGVRASSRGTVLDTLRQSGSFRVLFPDRPGRDLEVVSINTAGGITGGDTFVFSAEIGTGAGLSMTTQAAERAYRAHPGQVGTLKNNVTVGANGHLNWLPQETILFQGCALKRSLRIDLGQNASALMVEPVVFGRKAMGETLTNANFSDRIEIRRKGQVAYLDALNLNGDIASQMSGAHTGHGSGAMASIVFISPKAAGLVEQVRALLKAMTLTQGGASLLAEDMLVLRLLAPDSYLLRQTMIPVLNLLSGDTLPRSWMT